MPTPEELLSSLNAVNSSNVATGLDFLLQRTLDDGKPERCYIPDGVNLIRALAAAKESEVLTAITKLKARFGKDFRPQHFRRNIAEVKAELTSLAAHSEPNGLLRSESGKIMIGHENCFQYFATDPKWTKTLGYNEFTGGIELLGIPPDPMQQKPGDEIEDDFDTNATRWLERKSGLLFKSDMVHRTVNILAKQESFHPVRDYLETLPEWDRTPRISTWLADYCGADMGSDESPAPLWFGRMFLISAVARIMRPGCQVDHMLVLEGKTGIGKSSAVRALVPRDEWFTDQLSDFTSKDVSQELRGVWIIELSELDAWTRADAKTAKRFISRREERFRQPYGKRVGSFPRQCVFIGTSETDNYGTETMRRQWPVKCASIDIPALLRDRDQLWAEALAAFRAGENWHPDAEQATEAAVEQRKRFNHDIWTEDVLEKAGKMFDERAYSDGEGYVSILMILKEMGIGLEKRDYRAEQKVATVLRMAGWEQSQRRLKPGYPATRVYKRGKE